MPMARLARIIVPDTPYHVTQRGNGRERTFFSDDDFALYRDLLGEAFRDAKVGVWAWCLMPNHVHLILTPSDGGGLRRALARVYRRYAGWSTRCGAGPGISGKAGSARSRWTRITLPPRSGM